MRARARVRSHCRFRDRGTEHARGSGVERVGGGGKRRCGRARRPRPPRRAGQLARARLLAARRRRIGTCGRQLSYSCSVVTIHNILRPPAVLVITIHNILRPPALVVSLSDVQTTTNLLLVMVAYRQPGSPRRDRGRAALQPAGDAPHLGETGPLSRGKVPYYVIPHTARHTTLRIIREY
jgi:hypothetical protein